MAQDLARVIELMHTRLKALQSLADEITAGQQACVTLELGALHLHDKEKERLCGEVSHIDAELVKIAGIGPHERFATRLAAQREDTAQQEIQQRIRNLGQRSEAARLEVARRNQAYAEFLRRARLNINVMNNVIAHCLGIYPLWASAALAVSPWERGY